MKHEFLEYDIHLTTAGMTTQNFGQTQQHIFLDTFAKWPQKEIEQCNPQGTPYMLHWCSSVHSGLILGFNLWSAIFNYAKHILRQVHQCPKIIDHRKVKRTPIMFASVTDTSKMSDSCCQSATILSQTNVTTQNDIVANKCNNTQRYCRKQM